MLALALRSRLLALTRDLGLAAVVALPGLAAAAGPPSPEALHAVLERTLDNPREALALADDAALAPLDSESRFWRLLGKAAAYTLLDRSSDVQRSVDEARARLGALPTATLRHHLWLEAYAIGALFRREESTKLIARSVELRRAAAPLGDEYLLCEIAAGDLFLLRETYALDEAWRVAEDTERCGRKLGQLHLETTALIAMGSMASSLSSKAPAESYFERALEVLGQRPARFQRGWIEWEMGNTLARLGQHDRAARSFEISLALSHDLGDATGEAIVTLDLAALRLAQSDPQRVIELVRGVMPTLRGGEAPVRLAAAHGLLIEALARLKRPEVLQEIDKARALESAVLPAPDRARLERRMADGYASQGQYVQAYAALKQAGESTLQGEQSIRDTQVLRLQARYEIARREAELADLRHRAETDQLTGQTRAAQQRARWAVVVALAGLLACALWFGVRAMRRRRQLADLMMRDDLTGAPSRRAMFVFLQQQYELCSQLDIELSVALLDLDRFKQINERYGHSIGDRALRAFAEAGREVLRGQERMGRYSGDKWLLVLPGTAIDEMPEVFGRLRKALQAKTIAGLGSPHGVTLSMGAAAAGDAVDSVEALIEEAQRQLYRAKAAGRDRLCCAHRSRGEAAPREVAADVPGEAADPVVPA